MSFLTAYHVHWESMNLYDQNNIQLGQHVTCKTVNSLSPCEHAQTKPVQRIEQKEDKIISTVVGPHVSGVQSARPAPRPASLRWRRCPGRAAAAGAAAAGAAQAGDDDLHLRGMLRQDVRA